MALPASPPPSGSTAPARPDTAASGGPIRVFLVDDHAITLWGLQRLIESRPEAMGVVGTADSWAGLIAHPALPLAEVLVLDLDLADQDSLELLPQLQRLSTARVLVLTASEDSQRHCRAIELGARGILHKAEAPQQILAAIEQVHAGAAWIRPELMGQVLGRLTGHAPRAAPPPDAHQTRIASLTPREREIVRLLSQRPGDKLLSLAGQLGMSESTLRNHLTTVYAKLGVRGRLELHVYATEQGLASP